VFEKERREGGLGKRKREREEESWIELKMED
jgi:hypothetical protein